ncbi:MAG: GntR family transcriptional regulator [Synergistaceae bacterium]|nr:GntR family transcriptional regulator [Synergistaceae bacterium]
MTERAYFELRNGILNGEIGPGAYLLEERLAARLGMSRTPIRTALKMLLTEGFLIQGEDRRLRVAGISLKELEETFAARRAVEGAIADLACRAGGSAELARLEHFVYDEELAHREHNRLLILHSDRNFHAQLARMAGNAFLADFQERLGGVVSRFLALSSTLNEEIILALEEHRAIVAALAGRDPKEARSAMLRHLDNIEDRIRRRVGGPVLDEDEGEETGTCRSIGTDF